MLRKMNTPNDDIVAFEIQGYLTKEDYTQTMIPNITKARSAGKKLKFLLHFSEHFEGFTTAGAWEDFKLGIHYMNVFERIVVVSDKQWLLNSVSMFGSLMPCTVKTYKNNELSNAIAWLDSGDIGFDHQLDEKNGIVVAEISAPLTSDNFHLLSHTVDTWMEKGNQLNGLVIHAKEFPGWENLGSLFSHLEFIKDHHTKIKRVALCADTKLFELLPALGKHFVKAEVQQFSFKELEEAKKWASHH